MKHTPGPWSVERETVGHGETFRIIRWYISPNPDVGRGFKPIATIHAGFTCTEADAQLISAAPELLAACQNAYARSSIRDLGCPLVVELIEAIKKATGELP